MNFTQWSTELFNQHERMKDTALIDVHENLDVDGRQVFITLGRGRNPLDGICLLDGLATQVRMLRPIYTHHKTEFDAMLDSLTASVDTVMGATNHLMESLTEDAIPDAMIARMTGEQTSGEPKELIMASVKSKMETLQETLLVRLRLNPKDEPVLKSFGIEFPSVADRKLELELYQLQFRITWGEVLIDTDASVEVPDTEEGMYFLANYKHIEEILLKAVEMLGSVKVSVA